MAEAEKKEVVVPEAEEATDLEVVGSDSASEEAEIVESDQKKRAQECVTRLREYRSQATELFINVSEEIHKVHKDNLYIFVENPNTGEFYSSFKEFVENEMPYGVRKAHYLVKMWDHYVVEHGEGKRDFLESVEHLGASKLMLLTGVLTPENKDEWMDIAEEKSCRELEDYVNKLLGDDEETEEEPTGEDLKTEQLNKMQFQLFDDQLDAWNSAAKIAGSAIDSDNKGEILAAICLDFISHNQDLDTETKPKSAYFKKLESALGVKLMVIGDKDFIYGIENLDEAINNLDDAVSPGEAEDEF